MPRLTRAESQAATRDRLIDTAAALFLTHGYSATSLELIADTAGYSKGAVYSNFAGKDALCFEALRHIRLQRTAGLLEVFTDPTTVEAGLAAFARWADRTLGDTAWTSLEIEFAVRTRTDPALSDQFAEDAAAIRGLLGVALTELCERVGVTPVLPPQEAATALLSLGIGLGIQRALDPTLSAQILVDATRALIGTSTVAR